MSGFSEIHAARQAVRIDRAGRECAADGLAPSSLATIARRLRAALEPPLAPDRTVGALAEACRRWRDRNFQLRRETVVLIAGQSGFSIALLDESLDALLRPFTESALAQLAAKLRTRGRLFGFVMPGNVAGAGLHEICQALLGGASVMIKTSSVEPLFFTSFARSLREVDPVAASRIAVLNWRRERGDLTSAMKTACDYAVAFGDDETIARLSRASNFIGFGERASGAVVAADCDRMATAAAIARDVTLFEQRGCLSPHHVFVEDFRGALGRVFAEDLANALRELSGLLAPPASLALGDAARIRAARENARWRRIAGQRVEMWEGERFGWTVIYDRDAEFRISPCYRTVYVSPIRDGADLENRLKPVAGKLEAFAVADPSGRLEDIRASLRTAGVSYVAAPGEMQSPPLAWRHGGGALLDLLQSS